MVRDWLRRSPFKSMLEVDDYMIGNIWKGASERDIGDSVAVAERLAPETRDELMTDDLKPLGHDHDSEESLISEHDKAFDEAVHGEISVEEYVEQSSNIAARAVAAAQGGSERRGGRFQRR